MTKHSLKILSEACHYSIRETVEDFWLNRSIASLVQGPSIAENSSLSSLQT